MTRREEAGEESVGNDSFLDVITNVVGILIILVMVVGYQAKNAPLFQALAKERSEVATLEAQANTIEQDVHGVVRQMTVLQSELVARSAERDQISTLITAAERQLADRREALSSDSRNKYDAARDLALLNEELARLEEDRRQAETASPSEVIKVENYPTPLSKSVDGREVHFQLSNGRVTFVPFEALVSRLKNTMRESATRLQDQSELTDVIGPISGFRLRYALERFDTPQGSLVQVMHIDFLPASSQLGEPLDAALAANSHFRNELQMISPRQYTITVWTYPDSFADFRRLKQELYGMGYAVAARPLASGMPISASPQGSKSSAE